MKRAILAALLTATLVATIPGNAAAQKVLTPDEAGKMVTIKDLDATPSSVNGVIVNNTRNVIRDVEVAIEYHWMWANEFKPGSASPGRALIIKVDKELRPGESTAFHYVPDPPLDKRKDGRFNPEVAVAGFTVVIPTTTAER